METGGKGGAKKPGYNEAREETKRTLTAIRQADEERFRTLETRYKDLSEKADEIADALRSMREVYAGLEHRMTEEVHSLAAKIDSLRDYLERVINEKTKESDKRTDEKISEAETHIMGDMSNVIKESLEKSGSPTDKHKK